MSKKTVPSPVGIITASDWGYRFLTERGYKVTGGFAGLRELDRFFDDHVDESTHQPTPGGALADQTDMTLVAIGMYLGEILLRNYGGRWALASDDYVLPQLLPTIALNMDNGVECWPVKRVCKRVYEGRANRIYDYATSGILSESK